MRLELAKIEKQPFDLQYLNAAMGNLRYPRNKISKLLNQKEIYSLKNGLYILSEYYNRPVVLETAANLIYGPSYVSLEYALAYYNMIPEAVFNITSVTTGRRKIFNTIRGSFTYSQIKASYYSMGYEIKQENGVNYLIATPEKALCDKLYLSPQISNLSSLEEFLYEDMRIETGTISALNSERIAIYSQSANSTNINLLMRLIS